MVNSLFQISFYHSLTLLPFWLSTFPEIYEWHRFQYLSEPPNVFGGSNTQQRNGHILGLHKGKASLLETENEIKTQSADELTITLFSPQPSSISNDLLNVLNSCYIISTGLSSKCHLSLLAQYTAHQTALPFSLGVAASEHHTSFPLLAQELTPIVLTYLLQ